MTGRQVRSWSKLYIPLIFSALGTVPTAAAQCVALSASQRVAGDRDIARAQAWWRRRFSRWDAWVAAIRAKIDGDKEEEGQGEAAPGAGAASRGADTGAEGGG